MHNGLCTLMHCTNAPDGRWCRYLVELGASNTVHRDIVDDIIVVLVRKIRDANHQSVVAAQSNEIIRGCGVNAQHGKVCLDVFFRPTLVVHKTTYGILPGIV